MVVCLCCHLLPLNRGNLPHTALCQIGTALPGGEEGSIPQHPGPPHPLYCSPPECTPPWLSWVSSILEVPRDHSCRARTGPPTGEGPWLCPRKTQPGHHKKHPPPPISELSSASLSPQSAGVMSVYLFMKRYTAEDMYRPHPGFYRPRLSNCSDYSGQFLHPDAWIRGRSPSDISSDASLQMNSNYPALLKCPDYDQMSSSPC